MVTIMGSNSASPLDILLLTIMGIVSIVSLLGNGFITVVLGQKWLQNRKMLSCDLLLTTLSMSRFVMQLVASLNSLLYIISSDTYVGSLRQAVLYVIWIFCNMANLSSVTWLSVFYCVKVTNFGNRVFFWLKPRINMLVPRLLGTSVVISSIFLLPSVVGYLRLKKLGDVTGTLPGSANQSEGFNYNLVILFPAHITFTSINVIISIIASTLLLTSLWKHTRNLKKRGVGEKDLSTQVHINVIIPLLFYIFFYLLYFGCLIISASNVIKLGSTERLVVDILAATFPSSHSITLILTNPMLKEMAARILNIGHRASLKGSTGNE